MPSTHGRPYMWVVVTTRPGPYWNGPLDTVSLTGPEGQGRESSSHPALLSQRSPLVSWKSWRRAKLSLPLQGIVSLLRAEQDFFQDSRSSSSSGEIIRCRWDIVNIVMSCHTVYTCVCIEHLIFSRSNVNTRQSPPTWSTSA